MKQKKEFCRFLKHGLIIHGDNISPCCFYNGADGNRDKKQKIGTGKQITEYQLQWENSNYSQTCVQCINQEKYGGISYRMSSFDVIPDDITGIGYLELFLTPECNLACVLCDAASSDTWYKENIKFSIPQSKIIHDIHSSTSNYNKLLHNVNLDNIMYLKLKGGEPLIDKSHLAVLNALKHPEKVTLYYVSNFSVMPSAELLKCWQKFKLVKWAASLDGVEQHFEYIRWPYKWKKLQSFAKKAINVVPDNVMFSIEYTLNPLNIFYYDRMEEWHNSEFSQNKSGDKVDINVHSAYGILGLDKTPESLRNVIRKKYNNFIPEFLDHTPVSSTNGTLDYLDKLTIQRGLDWRVIFPEIQQYF
jgi:hypothetical protein